MTSLIDPHLVVAPTTCSTLSEDMFWERLINVASNARIEIGVESFYWVIQQLEHLGYPNARVDFGPSHIRRECQSAVEKVLSRVSTGKDEVEDSSLEPEYLGSQEARLCIVMDATQHGEKLDALMTDSDHWTWYANSVALGYRDVELLYSVDQLPLRLTAQKIKNKFKDRRLHILGGAPTKSLMTSLRDDLGFVEELIHWIPSEKSKPARDIDKRWAGLDPERDIAVCITGRISHSLWEMGDKAAMKRGLNMIECSSQGKLVDALKVWSGNV